MAIHIQYLYPDKTRPSIGFGNVITSYGSPIPVSGNESIADCIDDGVSTPDYDFIEVDTFGGGDIQVFSDKLLIRPSGGYVRFLASGEIPSIPHQFELYCYALQDPDDEYPINQSGRIFDIKPMDFKPSGSLVFPYILQYDIQSLYTENFDKLNDSEESILVLNMFGGGDTVRIYEMEVVISGSYLNSYNDCSLIIGNPSGNPIASSGCFEEPSFTGDYLYYAEFDQNILVEQIKDINLNNISWVSSGGPFTGLSGASGGYGDTSAFVNEIYLSRDNDEDEYFNQFTLATWVKTTTNTGNETFVEFIAGASDVILRFTRDSGGGNKLIVDNPDNPSPFTIATTDVNENLWSDEDEWVLIVYRQRPSEVKLLINNSELEVNYDTIAAALVNRVKFGHANIHFGDFIIWEQFLTNGDCADLWNGGAGTLNKFGNFASNGSINCFTTPTLFLQADAPGEENYESDLFLLNGQFFESGEIDLFLKSSLADMPTPEGMNLYLEVNDGTVQTNTPLVLQSPQPGSGNFITNLYTVNYESSGESVNLYLQADDANPGLYPEDLNLFIRGQILSESDLTNLFIQPTNKIIVGGPIPSGSVDYEFVEGASLFTTSHFESGENINLMLHGGDGGFYSSVESLYISNFENPSGNVTLVVGPGSPKADFNLYIKTLETMPRQSGDFGLFTWAVDGSGTRNTTNIFMGGAKYQEFNLFIQNNEGYSIFEDFNLFLNADGNKITNNGNLIVINDYVLGSGIRPLYIEGPDRIHYSGEMPLFIARENEGVALHSTLFLPAVSGPSGNFNMFIDGIGGSPSNNVNLVMLEPTVDMSGNTNLYSHGF